MRQVWTTGGPAVRVRVGVMADNPLDLTLDAARLTAQLVDLPSESGSEKPSRT